MSATILRPPNFSNTTNRLLFPHKFLNFSACDFLYTIFLYYILCYSFGPKSMPLTYFYFGCNLLLSLPVLIRAVMEVTPEKKLFHYLRPHPSCIQCCVGLYWSWSDFRSFPENCNIYICNLHLPWWLLLIKASVNFTKRNFVSTISHRDFHNLIDVSSL